MLGREGERRSGEEGGEGGKTENRAKKMMSYIVVAIPVWQCGGVDSAASYSHYID
jgi:hypothetical protein